MNQDTQAAWGSPMDCAIRRRRPHEGFALVIVLGVAAFTAIVVLSMMQSVKTDMAAVGNSVDTERAYYLAQTAVEHGKALLRDNPTWSGSSKEIVFPSRSPGSYKFSVQQLGKETVIGGQGQYRGIVQTAEYRGVDFQPAPKPSPEPIVP